MRHADRNLAQNEVSFNGILMPQPLSAAVYTNFSMEFNFIAIARLLFVLLSKIVRIKSGRRTSKREIFAAENKAEKL